MLSLLRSYYVFFRHYTVFCTVYSVVDIYGPEVCRRHDNLANAHMSEYEIFRILAITVMATSNSEQNN